MKQDDKLQLDSTARIRRNKVMVLDNNNFLTVTQDCMAYAKTEMPSSFHIRIPGWGQDKEGEF